MTPSLVITGLVPVIPIRMGVRFAKRDGRHKAGHDEEGLTLRLKLAVIPPILRTCRTSDIAAPGGRVL